MSTLSTNPMILDAVGIISLRPVIIKKIVLFPNGIDDYAQFYYWNAGSYLAQKTRQTTTVATGVITSTANFTTALVQAYGVIKILGQSTIAAGTASANVGLTRLIVSRDSDNQITTAPTTLTDEAAATYSWQTFAAIIGPKIYCTHVAKEMIELDFAHSPIDYPCLALGVLSTSAVVHLYI